MMLAYCIIFFSFIFSSTSAYGQTVNSSQTVNSYQANSSNKETKNKEKSVLVIPSLSAKETASDSFVLDVLLASIFEELGYRIIKPNEIIDEYHKNKKHPLIKTVQDLYLNNNLEEALDYAFKIRKFHLKHYGDFLMEKQLLKAELFIVKILVNLNREYEATEMAINILNRHPQLSLNPVEYSPSVQTLWLSAKTKQSRMQPKEHDAIKLKKLGQSLNANLVITSIRKKEIDEKDWLMIALIPTKQDEKTSRYSIELGAKEQWSKQIRKTLEGTFPSLKQKVIFPFAKQQSQLLQEGQTQMKRPKRWYKKPVFWTIVGVVTLSISSAVLANHYIDTDPSTDISTQEPIF